MLSLGTLTGTLTSPDCSLYEHDLKRRPPLFINMCIFHSACALLKPPSTLYFRKPLPPSTMAGDKKHKRSKRSATPSSDSFGDSEYSAKEYSVSGSGSLTPLSPSSSSSINTNNLMGLTLTELAYVKAMEHAGLADSDESTEEESSKGEGGNED